MIDVKGTISLYQSLFSGRTDIDVLYREKDGCGWYMPAYEVDGSAYNRRLVRGGAFKAYKNKTHLLFDHSAIESHLSEKELCGIYPLFEILSYIERSCSGNSGHLCIFFEDTFPTSQSWNIMFEMLRYANIILCFIYLRRNQLSKKMVVFLREQLNFYNVDYLVKKNLGKSTFNTEKFFKLIAETNRRIMSPRGFSATLVQFCDKEKISYKIL